MCRFIKIEVPYGRSSLSCQVASRAPVRFLEPFSSPPVSHSLLLDRACEQPGALQCLAAFLEGQKHVLFVINDATRPTPSSLVAEHILNKWPVVEPYFAIATGTHATPSRDDLEQVLGPLAGKYGSQVTVNNCRDMSAYDFKGRTSRGTPVHIHRIVSEYDKVIVINSIEPHYFAGFTGGRKSIVPGLAAFETIEANHRLALSPRSALMKLEGNPVHEDLTEAVGLLEKKIFALNLVLGRDGEIIEAAGGDLIESFPEAASKAGRMFMAALDDQYDIVISAARPPLDADLYQAHKAIENVRGAVRNGGIIILAAACPGGIGNDTFAELLELSRDTAVIRDIIEKKYRLGYHKAAKLAEFMERGRIFAVSGVEPELLENIHITPFSSLQEAVDEALVLKGNSASILIVPDGNMIVPLVPGKT